jgi:predicted RNase H-like nuclease
VHPEISFACWNGGAPLSASKKRLAGRNQRACVIAAAWGSSLVADALAWRKRFAARACQPDDVLDALACLWTAERIARRAHSTLPGDPPPRDAQSLPMRIVV